MARKTPESTGWLRYSGVGIEFAAAVGGFALLGYWIDRRYESQPWGLLICAILGLIGGTYNLIRSSLAAFKDAEHERQERKRHGKDGTP